MGPVLFLVYSITLFLLGVWMGINRQREYWSYDRYIEGYRDGVHGRTLKRYTETY